MTPEAISALKSELSHFTGAEKYHRWSSIFVDVLTDGAKYLAEKASAFWLMDIVGSVRAKILAEGFAVVQFHPEGDGGYVSITDGNDKVLHHQGIAYSDFPFSQKLFVQPCDENRLCIMLPSEY